MCFAWFVHQRVEGHVHEQHKKAVGPYGPAVHCAQALHLGARLCTHDTSNAANCQCWPAPLVLSLPRTASAARAAVDVGTPCRAHVPPGRQHSLLHHVLASMQSQNRRVVGW